MPGEKKSRKTLALSPQLREELMTYLAARTEHTLQRSEQLRSKLIAMSALGRCPAKPKLLGQPATL